MIGRLIRNMVSIDDRFTAVLSIELIDSANGLNAYRVICDFFREQRMVVAEIKGFDYAEKTRIDLIAEAWRVIAAQERT